MTCLPTRYDFAAIEPDIWRRWTERDAFAGIMDPAREPFCVVIPPPNVTGVLHIGHVLDNTPQDIMVRFQRMRGKGVVWIPGTDHAGIATQNVVKRALDAEGIDYRELGREAFLERVWQWRFDKGGAIIEQLKRLGCSCDFSRERFTMDEGLSRAVTQAFLTLHERDLIYRGWYLTNWCCHCRTVLSDDEVEHREVEGAFWHLRYPRSDGQGEIVVATTRPETMLGDTAVAVHPDPQHDLEKRLAEAEKAVDQVGDQAARTEALAEVQRLREHIDNHLERLKEVASWVGKPVRLPLCDREIPIIADPYVKTDFGTGQLKVTPGHDPNDYQIGKRHGLPSIAVIGFDGRITDAAPEAYRGLDRAEARRAVLRDLEAGGFLVDTEARRHEVGHCYRCHQIVEPLETEQWFVRMRPLAQKAQQAVREGRIRIIPDKFEANFHRWMDEVRDWCISRQLWWGHRIPIWYPRDAAGAVDYAHPVASVDAPAPDPSRGITGYEQDPDVLDTWFSSALWPFSTLGWPESTSELAYWYPNAWLNSGKDILFFWDARMIMAGLELLGEVPWRELYLHGIARDDQGRKISKSLNNSPDVLHMLDERGADALRLGIIAKSPAGEDTQLSDAVYDYGRNFCTKLWNATRLLLTRAQRDQTDEWEPVSTPLALEDRWINSRLHRAAREVTRRLENSEFSQAADAAHTFFWGDFCDWYLEFIKDRLDPASGLTLLRSAPPREGAPSRDASPERTRDGPRRDIEKAARFAAGILQRTLKLLHPFVPFITEYLYGALREQGLAEDEGELLMLAPWFEGDPGMINEAVESRMARLQALVSGVRNVRTELRLPREALTLTVWLSGDATLDDEEQRLLSLRAMAHLECCNVASLQISGHLRTDVAQYRPELDLEGKEGEISKPRPRPSATVVAPGIQAFVHLEGKIDLEAERARLDKLIADLEKRAQASRKRLSNEQFVAGAPAHVVEGARTQLRETEERLHAVRASRADLGD